MNAILYIPDDLENQLPEEYLWCNIPEGIEVRKVPRLNNSNIGLVNGGWGDLELPSFVQGKIVYEGHEATVSKLALLAK